MKLSMIVTEYRDRMQISQREFSRRCGLSNSYISFIEKGMNPKTGRPIVPTIEQYKKLADGMGISLQHLFSMLDEESPVELHSPTINFDELTNEEKKFILAYRAADERARIDALTIMLDHPDE